jgi:hypothetical protein
MEKKTHSCESETQTRKPECPQGRVIADSNANEETDEEQKKTLRLRR